jgi:hypothetical protein
MSLVKKRMFNSNKNLLIKSSIRYFFRHPWQFGLSILGIVLGVAVVVSVDLANQSAGRAFEPPIKSLVRVLDCPIPCIACYGSIIEYGNRHQSLRSTCR